MARVEKLDKGRAIAAGDALLAAPVAEQRARREEFERRREASMKRGYVPAALRVAVTLLGIKTS